MQNELTNDDLSDIRDAAPHLDLIAIRSLRRAGFDIVRCAPAPETSRNLWDLIPGPMASRELIQEHAAE